MRTPNKEHRLTNEEVKQKKIHAKAQRRNKKKEERKGFSPEVKKDHAKV